MERIHVEISYNEDDDEVEVIKPPIEESNNANEGDEEFQKFTMTVSGILVEPKAHYDLATMAIT